MTNSLFFNRYTSQDALLDHLKQQTPGFDDAMKEIATTLIEPMHARLRPFFHLVSKPGIPKSSIAHTIAEAIDADYVDLRAINQDTLEHPLKDTLQEAFSSREADSRPLVIGIRDARFMTDGDQVIVAGLIYKDSQYPAPEIAAVFLMDTSFSGLPSYPALSEPLQERALRVELTAPSL